MSKSSITDTPNNRVCDSETPRKYSYIGGELNKILTFVTE